MLTTLESNVRITVMFVLESVGTQEYVFFIASSCVLVYLHVVLHVAMDSENFLSL